MSNPNLMHTTPWREQMNVVNHAVLNIKTCCFFFSLTIGCKLIVLFENILGLWQIYHGYNQLYGKGDDFTPQWFNAKAAQHNSEFNLFLGLIAFFCSHLLLVGVVFQRKICILIWICVMGVCSVAYMFYTQVFDCIPEIMLFDTFMAALQAYFVGVALAYYLQLDRSENSDEDLEVLFTASEA